MKIIALGNNNNSLKNMVISVGMFDGVHSGHQRLLSHLVAKARQFGTKAAVITFLEHPRLVLRSGKEQVISMLQTTNERMKSLEQCEIDCVFTLEFSQKLAALSPKQFLNLLITNIEPQALILGYDNYFGRHYAAELDEIVQKGVYETMLVQRVNDCVRIENEGKVSSTKIRKALSVGDLPSANAMLGYEYVLSGEVVCGMGQGRLLDFPTANLAIDSLKMLPLSGVYAVRVRIDEGKCLKGVLFVGQRKTFGLEDLSVEVHIFNFNSDIYNRHLELSLVSFIRPQRRFSTTDALKTQIKQDCDEVKSLFGLDC